MMLHRPVEVDSYKIETLIENNQCSTTREIADTLKITKSIVIGENEKCVFYFTEKIKTYRLFGQPNRYFSLSLGLITSLIEIIFI